MTVYPNINASLDCFSKEKCSPLLVPSLYTLLTMEWLQLWVCHCVFFTEWELAVMISMSPPCMPVVDHNSLYSPWNLHWEHLMVPRTTMLAAKPTVRFTFLWAWPSLCYWGKRRLSNKKFMTQPGFDLGPPEIPLLKKCRNLMNGSMFIFMKTWTDFFILDNTRIFCPENMVVLLQVAAQDGSCSTCMGFFKYLFCCLTSDISLAWVVSSFFEFLMQHWSGW